MVEGSNPDLGSLVETKGSLASVNIINGDALCKMGTCVHIKHDF